MRLLIQIMEQVRDEVGKDFPLLCRINGEDGSCQITVEDSRAVAVELEKVGAHAIEFVSGSMIESLGVPIYTSEVPQGNFAYLAEGMKRLICIPIISNIRINDPEVGEKILRHGKADLVSMSRALIADPEFPNKAASGRVEEINRCIACMICLDKAWKGDHVQCTVNARAGFEEERRIKPARRVKRVLVAGGGPAGLEAARVAAMRGHRVSLYEKDSRLGGQLLLAAKPPYKPEIQGLIDYLTTQVKKHGVRITLDRQVTVDLAREENPDAVIVATGAVPAILDIGLAEGTFVYPGDILCETVDVGQSVVVIGGGIVGAETAEFLARRKRQVSIVEMVDRVCDDMPMFAREDLLRSLRELGVNILTGTRVKGIKNSTVSLEKNGQTQQIQADTLVIATGSKADSRLAEDLKGMVPELYTIGDSREPRRAFEAIHEGFLAGHQI